MSSSTVLVVNEALEGATLAAFLRHHDTTLTWSAARKLCTQGRVVVGGRLERDPARRVARGETVELRGHGARIRQGVLPKQAILHVDDHVIVVDKPAGCLTLPFARDDRDTLLERTRAALRRMAGARDPHLGVVHRLDKETSGVLVFARTMHAKRHLETLFRAHRIEREYRALVHGAPAEGRIESVLVPDRGDGLRGSRRGGEPGQIAVTHVRRVRALGRASEVACTLETGRQHQIRIHLSEAGSPLVGEKVYVRDYTGPRIDAPRVMLHAFRLAFEHPKTGARLEVSVPPPADYVDTVSRLERERDIVRR